MQKVEIIYHTKRFQLRTSDMDYGRRWSYHISNLYAVHRVCVMALCTVLTEQIIYD